MNVLRMECKFAGTVLEIAVADTFWRRLRGLLFTRKLPINQGLLLRPCNSVHMMGMQYGLDVVYLNRSGRIIKIVRLHPWQCSMCREAAQALELALGVADVFGLRIGGILPECAMDGAESR